MIQKIQITIDNNNVKLTYELACRIKEEVLYKLTTKSINKIKKELSIDLKNTEFKDLSDKDINKIFLFVLSLKSSDEIISFLCYIFDEKYPMIDNEKEDSVKNKKVLKFLRDRRFTNLLNEIYYQLKNKIKFN